MTEERFLESAMKMRSKLYHVAVSILWNEQDAADAVQEAMLKGWKHRGGLREESLFEVWFMRILVNQCRDLQRRQIRRRGLLERAGREYLSANDEAPRGEVLEAIHSLPERLRLPVLMYYYEGYSQKEIGGMVGATPEQVKSRIRQGRDKLRVALAPQKGGDGHD